MMILEDSSSFPDPSDISPLMNTVTLDPSTWRQDSLHKRHLLNTSKWNESVIRIHQSSNPIMKQLPNLQQESRWNENSNAIRMVLKVDKR